ncbi:uncharacterized protein [Lolium perenne]|uniref:uncharacterized protein n=1 Tax=Lolium perenne TaxID=4522 RepID=UPI0021F57F3A|nr:protein GAT2-like [Lolium perenne]
MRKPTSFLDDVCLSEEDENFDPADPLCCPDDPLDEVLKYIPTLDEKILEALGIDCSSPPQHDAQLVLYRPTAEEEHGAQGLKSTSAAGNSYYSATSSGSSYCGLSSASTSWESESAGRASSFQYWNVPTKRRRQAVNVRNRKRPWSHTFLTFPSTPLAAVVHDAHNNIGEFSYDNDIKPRKLGLLDDGGNFSKIGYKSKAGKLSSGNVNGGHRPSAGQKREKQKEGTCSHCGTTETPQWRAGPNGPRTLCNACGIRYRMGGDKLVPEYRPSTSPFFKNGEHSNRHSKVEKLREKKVKALKVGFSSVGVLTPARPGGSVDSTIP